MLIVIEGLDGAGKSTQVKKMKKYLSATLGEYDYIHFPRYDAPVYGDLISRYLRGSFGSLDSVHPQLVALLFAEDRHGAAPQLRSALESGRTVLLDRYVYSNIAYQCAKLPSQDERTALRDWIMKTEYGDFNLPKPDLNIFLDVPICFVRESLSGHRSGSDRQYLEGNEDIHESDIDFQTRVRDMYRAQAEMDPDFITLDCSDEFGAMLPPDEIFEKIRQVYESHK